MFNRHDDRNPNEVRRLSCRLSELKEADGSSHWSSGSTSVLSGVYGPIESKPSVEDFKKSVFDISVRPATERCGPLESHIESILSGVLSEYVDVSFAPRSTIRISSQVVGNDGSLLSHVINGVLMALLDAGIPVKRLFAAVTIALYVKEAESHYLVDPSSDEESGSIALARFVFADGDDESPMIAIDSVGNFTDSQWEKCNSLAARTVSGIFSFQRLVLESRSGKGTSSSEKATSSSLSSSADSSNSKVSIDDLKGEFASFGQGHVLSQWNRLSPSEREDLLTELRECDIARIRPYIEACSKKTKLVGAGAGFSSPFPLSDARVNTCPLVANDQDPLNSKWYKIGIQSISRGEVAAVITAGGQGTRLGFNSPKGLYNIGLPSNKSLFCLIFDRLKRLLSIGGQGASVPVYILTSPATHADTVQYFVEQGFFGYREGDVRFVTQSWLPCLSEDGLQILLSSPSSLCKGPDGNGGVYKALASPMTYPRTDHQISALEDMERRGVQYLHLSFVDNAMGIPAEPGFMGSMIDRGMECGCMVIRRKMNESVGVLCEREDVIHRRRVVSVVEYSELSREQRVDVDEAGDLRFWAGNIGVHYYSLPFLRRCCDDYRLTMTLHEAKKSMSFFDVKNSKQGETKCTKLELFVFDVFPRAGSNFGVYEVPRERFFAPVKNAPGTPTDSPDTARSMISNASKVMIESVGGTVVGSGDVEIDPSISLFGEGEALGKLVRGRTLTTPVRIK